MARSPRESSGEYQASILVWFLAEFVLEIAQRASIVERMDVAGDHLRQRPHLRPFERIARSSGGLGCTSSRYSMMASD